MENTKPRNPAWVRPAFLGLLGATAVLYLWNLAASGWANAYYSAATLAIVFLAVRRWFGPAAGLLAGSVVALTPVAGLIFRFNNPDALLVLLLTGAVYATLRAIEDGRTRWLILAGALVGAGFLAKELQAFVVLPVLGGVYLFAGPPALGRRIRQSLLALLAMIVACGWWVAAVELFPSASRPYIGGSQNNDLLSLIFGYNGFGRLTGNESGSVGGFGALGSR